VATEGGEAGGAHQIRVGEQWEENYGSMQQQHAACSSSRMQQEDVAVGCSSSSSSSSPSRNSSSSRVQGLPLLPRAPTSG